MRPYRQCVVDALLVVLQHRFDHVGVAFAVDDVVEGHQGAVRIPQREDGVIGKAFGLVDVLVEAAVLAVHVHVNRRVDQCVVKRRIEHRQLVVAAFGFDDVQLLGPFCTSFGGDLFESFVAGFGFEVLHCPFGADGRQSHFDIERRVVAQIEIEVAYDLASLNIGEITVRLEFGQMTHVFGFLVVDVAVVVERLRELHRKIGVVRPCPAVCDAVTHQRGVVHDLYARPQHLAVVVVDRMVHVEDDARRIGVSRIGVAMHARALGSGQLRFYAVVVEHHFVIARRGDFGIMREPRTVARIRIGRRARVELQCSGGRHDQDVAQIGVAGAAEVGVAEADDRRIFVLVSRTVFVCARLVDSVDVVRDGVRVGTQRNDSVRYAGTGENVSHFVGADDRVDLVYRAALLGRQGGCARQQTKR